MNTRNTCEVGCMHAENIVCVLDQALYIYMASTYNFLGNGTDTLTRFFKSDSSNNRL